MAHITQSELKYLFRYDNINGGLIWNFSISPTKDTANKRFGSVENIKGYRKGMIHKKTYREHRLVWIWHYGNIPVGLEIDHINWVRDDNRIENLQLLTKSENIKRRKK